MRSPQASVAHSYGSPFFSLGLFMAKGDWGTVNWSEVGIVASCSAFIGVLRLLYLIRRGRKFVWFDVILEPCLALLGGMLAWGVMEVTDSPDVMQAVLTSLGAWGGPRTIHYFEKKYMGEIPPTAPAPLDTMR